ncbi:MAG TPA: hypothetical protein VK502_03170 [Candidatus Saccharimonadales bacterium]|nr:hypothetical protein [Candidatus Saccharimonadales bacterium]
MSFMDFNDQDILSFEKLEEWAREKGVAALCSDPYFEQRAVSRAFLYIRTTDNDPEVFLANGDFVISQRARWWLLDGDKPLLGTLGGYRPLGRSLSQFMNELPGTLAKFKPKKQEKLRAVYGHIWIRERYLFGVYEGKMEHLPMAIAQLKSRKGR